MKPFVTNPSAGVLSSFTDFQLGTMCLFAGEYGSLKTSSAVQVAFDTLKKTQYSVIYVDAVRKMHVSSSFRLLPSLSPVEHRRLIVLDIPQDWHNLHWLYELLEADPSIKVLVIDPASAVFDGSNAAKSLGALAKRLRVLCLKYSVLCILTTGLYGQKGDQHPVGGGAFLSFMDFVCLFEKQMRCVSSFTKPYRVRVSVNGCGALDIEVEQKSGAVVVTGGSK